MRFFSKTSSTAGLIAMLSATLLAGCSMDSVEIDDVYVPATAEERFPIKVAEAPVKMNVDARSGGLRADQVNSVIAFARDARANATSRIAVRYSSGSSKARKVASETAAVLVAQGVPRSSITTASYKGGGSTVTLSFHRKVAVSAECGDWSANMAGDQYNDPYPNFGCALQQNIAAMVANPEDHETPRAMTPVLAGSRSATIKKYNTGQSLVAGSSGSSDTGSDSNATSTP